MKALPYINCKCGKILQYGDIPCAIEWLFISDVDFDKFQGSIDSESLYRHMNSFLKCNNCNRLYIFWNGFGNMPSIYYLEE